MKCTIILMLAACLQVSASGYSQTISVKLREVPFEKALKEIAKKSGHGLFYLQEQIKSSKPVSIVKENTDVKQVLDELFKEQPLKYEITNKTIVVSLKEEKKDSQRLTPELTSRVEPLPPPPNIDVTARVTDEDGNPLLGASVMIKGTKTGTQTNEAGWFTLRGVEEGATLEVTYVGFEKSSFNTTKVPSVISLKRNASILSEVVIKPYWRETKRTEVGNSFSVTAKEIENSPVNNPLLAIQGRGAGITVTQANGIPGGGINVRIQGVNNLNPTYTGSDPFIVIDGVPYISQNLNTFLGGSPTAPILGKSSEITAANRNFGNPLAFINTSDIESITVLKDADATAIYGSRAANGAILITTKRGKAGALKTTLNIQQGFAQVGNKMKLLNSQQYMQMRREAKANDNAAVLSTDFDLRGLWDTTRYTDWQKELIGGTALFSKISAGISGGTNNVQYLMSTTFSRETSVFPGDFANTSGSLHFNISTTSADQRFKAQLGGSYLINNNELPAEDFTARALSMPPVAPPLYNPDGTLHWAPDPLNNNSSTWFNPLVNQYKLFDSKTNNLISNANLSYRLSPNFEIRSSFGFVSTISDQFVGYLNQSVRPEDRVARVRSAIFSFNTTRSFIIEPQIEYNQSIGKGRINVIVGSTFQNQTNGGRSLSISGQPSDQLLRDVNAALSTSVGAPDIGEYRYNALFARIGYTLSERYILNLTARRDGSSRFGGKNLFNNFGAAGLGWIISEERAFKKVLPFISFAKLKASYGVTGNDQIGDYRFMSLYAPNVPGIPYQGQGGLNPVNLPNPYLEWEETRKLQAGIDLGFFKNRLFITATYTQNRTSNALTEINLPINTGYSSFLDNVDAVIQNTGFEFTVSSTNINKNKIKWNTNFNITLPRNKLVSFADVDKAFGTFNTFVGEPLRTNRNFRFYGIDPQTGLFLLSDKNGNPTTTPSSVIDEITFIRTGPQFYGGLQNSISINGLSIDILIQFTKQYGRDVLLLSGYPGRFSVNSTLSVQGNHPVEVLQRWQKPGDVTYYPRFSTNAALQLLSAGDRGYTDLSYVRLKNVAFSYLLPLELIKKMKAQQLKVFVNAQNLLTLTRYRGLDPENLSTSSLPPLRVINFGFQVVF